MGEKKEGLFHEFFKGFSFKGVLKVIGVGLLVLVFLSISLALIKSLLLSGFLGVPSSERPGNSQFYKGGFEGQIQPGSNSYFKNVEEKSYDVYIKTPDKEKVVREIKGKEDLSNVIIESFSDGDNSAYFLIKVRKSYEHKFLDFLKTFNPDSISVNTQKESQQYLETERKLKSLESQLRKIEETINETESSYHDIIQLARENYDLTNLREAIKDKQEILISLYKNKQEILNEIGTLKSQLTSYENENDYVVFKVYVMEDKLVDLSLYKKEWRTSFKNLFNTLNSVVNSLTVGLLRTFLEAIRVIVYTILVSVMVLFTGKIVWWLARRIIYGKGK